MNSDPLNHLDLFLTELEESIAENDLVGARAMEEGEYEKVKDSMEKGSQLRELRDEITSLINRWASFLGTDLENGIQGGKSQSRSERNDQWTPGEMFKIPILQTLINLGGSGAIQEVLEQVGGILEPILNETDYLRLRSSPDTPFWQNTAAWKGFSLEKAGMITGNFSTGIWRITPEGRQWLANQK